MLLTIPVGSLDAVVAAMLKPIVDGVLTSKDTQLGQTLPYIVIGFAIVQGGFNYSSTYVNAWVGSKISMGLKRVLYDKLLTMDSTFYDRRNSGDILMRFFNDADLATAGLISNLKLFLTKFFSSLSLVAVMICSSWHLTLLALGIFVLAVYPASMVKRKIRDIATKTVGASSYFLTIYNETFSGNKIINSYTLENEFRRRYDKSLNFLFRLGIKMIQGSGWLSPLLHFIGSIGVALVLGVGTKLIVNETITAGNFAAFIASMLMLYTPLKSIGTNYVRVQQSFLAIERIYEMLEIKPEIKSNDGSVILEDIRAGFEFRGDSFGYVPDR